MTKCPVINCGNDMDPNDPTMYAISRRDNKTKICNSCGLSEAIDTIKKRYVSR